MASKQFNPGRTLSLSNLTRRSKLSENSERDELIGDTPCGGVRSLCRIFAAAGARVVVGPLVSWKDRDTLWTSLLLNSICNYDLGLNRVGGWFRLVTTNSIEFAAAVKVLLP